MPHIDSDMVSFDHSITVFDRRRVNCSGQVVVHPVTSLESDAMPTRRALLTGIIATFASPPVVTNVCAAAYPSRPVIIIVPFPAGGPTDTIARILSEKMSVDLIQPVIVENVTGAAGTIGAGRVGHSHPDGYTLCVGFLGTHVLNGAIYKLDYDVVSDFEPIGLLASNPQLIVARRDLQRGI
jgi:tripartite-type tricarboxylate transporter receptor subunit TctC